MEASKQGQFVVTQLAHYIHAFLILMGSMRAVHFSLKKR